MNRRTTMLLALTFLVGAAAGIGSSYITWRPYGEGSLTHAIVRKCGVREAPRSVEMCSQLVSDAVDAYFVRYYPGPLPGWATDHLDPLVRIARRFGNGRTAARLLPSEP